MLSRCNGRNNGELVPVICGGLPELRGVSVLRCQSLSCVQLFATPWTVGHQALLSMGFSWQEYWSRLPFPTPGDLPDLGIEPESPALQADSIPTEPPGKPLCQLGGDNLFPQNNLFYHKFQLQKHIFSFKHVTCS